jgi:RNA polymerase sigma-70 factor (ECF subfamily)
MLTINHKDYQPMAERAVKAYTRNYFSGFFSENDIQDLVSDVVLRMWAKRDQYDESRGTVSAWVNTIARNVVLDAAKREKRRRSFFSSASLVERVDDDGNVLGFVPVACDETDALVIAHDTERALRESVSTERDTRLLNGLLQELDDSELAAAEGVGIPTIQTAKCRLRKRLRAGI